MSKNVETVATSGGLGFCGALAILFIGLKLGNVITWPWIWVLSPLWIPALLTIVIIIIILLIAILIALIKK